MNIGDTALRFIAAWLTVGLGLFMWTASMRAMRSVSLAAGGVVPRRGWRSVRAIYLLPLAFALGLVGVGVVDVVRALTW